MAAAQRHQAPTLALKPSPNRRAINWGLGAVAVLFALLLGLIVLALIGGETGPVALLAGMIFAMLPVPVYITAVLWIDRYEAEPLWMLAMAFLWGATVAVLIAFIINTISALSVAMLLQDMGAGRAFGAVISAPIVEESSKALVLFIIFFWKKDEFDGILDGIVYAAMVGLGFAMTENIQYYGRAALDGGLEGEVFQYTFIMRGMFAAFSHPLFTSMTGIGLGWSRQSNNKAIKVLAPLAGLGAAMSLHSLWNLSATIFRGALFVPVYLLLMVPVFVATMVTIILALRREREIVRAHLLCDFQRGMFTQEEYNCLCSIRGRMRASYAALTGGGWNAWRARMQFNQMASELAFHRHRTTRSNSAGHESAAEREAAYLQMLFDLRRRLDSH